MHGKEESHDDELVEGYHLLIACGTSYHAFDQGKWNGLLMFYSRVVVFVSAFEVVKKLANCAIRIVSWVWSAGCQKGLCHISDGTEASAGNKVFVTFGRLAPLAFANGLSEGAEESVALFAVEQTQVGIAHDADCEQKFEPSSPGGGAFGMSPLGDSAMGGFS